MHIKQRSRASAGQLLQCKVHEVEGELRNDQSNPLSINLDYLLSNQWWVENNTEPSAAPLIMPTSSLLEEGLARQNATGTGRRQIDQFC